jgi:hypothetical protein
VRLHPEGESGKPNGAHRSSPKLNGTRGAAFKYLTTWVEDILNAAPDRRLAELRRAAADLGSVLLAYNILSRAEIATALGKSAQQCGLIRAGDPRSMLDIIDELHAGLDEGMKTPRPDLMPQATNGHEHGATAAPPISAPKGKPVFTDEPIVIDDLAVETGGAPDANDIARAHGIDALRAAIDGAECDPAASEQEHDGRAAANGAGSITAAARLVVRRASDIRPKAVRWVWPGRIAVGKHTCVAGEPGTGKSQLAIDVASTVTTGGTWPCGGGRSPVGSVMILSAEDGEADTIVPRLIAAGADRSRVHIISAVRSEDGKGRRTFNLQADLSLLEAKIRELVDVLLVIIDPVSSYLGKVDSHRNAELRGVLEPVGEMAERMQVAILTITHFSKGNSAATTTKALHRFIGSIAFVGAPRAAFAVLEDPDDQSRRLFLHVKNNLARAPQGLAFRLGQRLITDGILASSVLWEMDPVDQTADQALATAGRGEEQPSTQVSECAEFLRVLLADSPLLVAEIEAEARVAGLLGPNQAISQSRPMRDAREELGIKPRQRTGQRAGGWVWGIEGQMTSQRSDDLKNRRSSDGAEVI